jgi:hypothetical protein
VEVFIDNNQIKEYSFVKNGMNVLGCNSINELFFDVFEIKSKGLELVKEKKGDFNGTPIIELDLCIDEKLYKNVRFIIQENNSEIKINPNLLDHLNSVIFEKKNIEKTIPKKEIIIEETKPIKIKKIKKVSDKVQIVKEEKLIDKVKKEFISNIKSELLNSLKEEIETGLINKALQENVYSNFEIILENDKLQYKIQKLFSNDQNKFRKELIEIAEKISRREVLRFAESGGGTNGLSKDSFQQFQKIVFIIGDGINTEFTLNHNLNTKDLYITLYDNSTNEIIYGYVNNIDDNSTIVSFSVPIENQSCIVVILG